MTPEFLTSGAVLETLAGCRARIATLMQVDYTAVLMLTNNVFGCEIDRLARRLYDNAKRRKQNHAKD